MKAWLLDQLGGIDRLRLSETTDPTARDGEVVMRVQYAALNPADRYLAEGQYPAKPTVPHILGRDGIGTIIEVGPGVTNWTIGDRALILRSEIGVNRPGTFAEKVAVPADTIALVAFDAKTKTARSFARITNATTELFIYAQGRCSALPNGTIASKAGDKLVLRWVDKYGRWSAPSKSITVTRAK